jgi:hypothetical protein
MAVQVISKPKSKFYVAECGCGSTNRFEISDVKAGVSTYRDEGMYGVTIQCGYCDRNHYLGYGTFETVLPRYEEK